MRLESQTCNTPMTMPPVATVVQDDQIMNLSMRVVMRRSVYPFAALAAKIVHQLANPFKPQSLFSHPFASEHNGFHAAAVPYIRQWIVF